MKTPQIKPGDILSLRNGTKVKVLETDAPGDYPIVVRTIDIQAYDNFVVCYIHTNDGAANKTKSQIKNQYDLILP